MASLTGQTIASTYDALLKITDNGAITASLKQITDGLGNNTPLFLSATTVYVNGNFRVGGALYDVNNEPGTNGQFLVSTGTGVDWRNISEANLITGSGTTDFIAKFTASGAIGSSIISESVSGIGIGITATQKLHVDGNGLFTGTLTASNVSGSTSGVNTGDETNASIKTKLGQVSAIQDGYLSSVDYESFTNKVPNTRTITINGETFDLSANRTYNVNVGVTSFNTRTGAVVLSSSDVTTALGYTPALNSRIMTINGVGYDLSADRSWSVGTVTSVGTSAPLTGGTITGAGTIGITQANTSTDGYLSSTDWNTFNNKQNALGYTAENAANKGAINGYASLDGAGKVPSTQLPSYVDDVVEVANFAALPATGETGKIYITLDTNFVYRWSGSVYVKISEPNAVWGSITGTLSNQTDLQNALNAKVNNTRTLTINGTEFDLSANRTYNVGTVTSVGGTGTVSGLSLSGSVTGSGNLTLGGTLALTSSDVTTGLGYTPVTNARTLSINGTTFDLTANRSWNVGTVTSVGLELGTTGTDLSVANSPITSSGNITLNIPTASASNRGVLSSTDWSTFNNKQNALTLTTTGNSGSATLVGATLNIPTYTLAGLGGQPLLTNPVTGTGTSGYLTRFTGSTTVGNSVIFDNGTQIGIGTTSPAERLSVAGAIISTGGITGHGANRTSLSQEGVNGAFWQSYGADSSTVGTFTLRQASSDFSIVRSVLSINTSGNVGIGTNSPAIYGGWTGLDIRGGNGGHLIVGNTAATNRGEIYTDGNGFNVSAQTNNALILKTNDLERMRITSAGNVGIGTSSPTSMLTLRGTSPFIRIERDGVNTWQIQNNFLVNQNGFSINNITAGTTPLFIGENGNVGIGTSSPSNPLQVHRTTTATDVRIALTDGTTTESVNRGFNLIKGSDQIGYLFNYENSPIVLGTNGAERMRITSGGTILIGRTTETFNVTKGTAIFQDGGVYMEKVNSGVLDANRTGSDGVLLAFYKAGTYVGNISVTATSASFQNVSDYRLKQDLRDYSGLSIINRIKTYDFEWKSDKSRMHGVIAHELQEVLPYAVTGEKDGDQMQGVDYSKIIPALVKAIQEQQAQIEELKAKLK